MGTLQPSQATKLAVPIVAVGASAGGITALQKLLQSLPPRLPFALVILQHLPPGANSHLADLVKKWSPVPVLAAMDGTLPNINAIYIPSPAHILTFENGVFRTRPTDGGGRRPGIDSIDAFLESLAQREKPSPIAVILSGSGMDGTAGAIRVRQAGGTVIVQDPLTALHDSMPNAVIQRSIHDHVLPLGAIGRQLLACVDPCYKRPSQSVDRSDALSDVLGRIISLIRQRAGFDLSGYKPSPLLWRIQQRMDNRKVWSFEDYRLLIEDDPIELDALVRGIPIHVTEFFRDTDAWSALQDDVLYPLACSAEGRQPLRIWTPACSSGEEAYSVAMLLDEISHDLNKPIDFQIFATDASPELVATASRGVYRPRSIAGVNATRQSRFFYRVDDSLRVKRFLRERLVFATQHLLSDPPLSDLDLVTCRNLLIYLERDAGHDLLSVLHGSLRVGGYLFLGRSETYPLDEMGFETVSARWNIYRKTGSVQRRSVNRPARVSVPENTNIALRLAHEQFDIPSVLIDERCSVLRVYGNMQGLLWPAAGEPSLNLLDLLPQEWSTSVRHCVREALSEHKSKALSDLPTRGWHDSPVIARVMPLQPTADNAWDRVLVSFIREQDSVDARDAGGSSLLKQDLCAGRTPDWESQAQRSREEVDASREELLALNEELKSSNEQLNQSNEYLTNVNNDLKNKVEQLAMQNRVLASSSVRALFLDNELRLRWFTSSMRDVFPFTLDDVGRSITDLVPFFQDKHFYPDIRCVLDASEPREALIYDSGGRVLRRKVFPYLSGTGEIEGVAITFSEIGNELMSLPPPGT